MSGVLCFTRTPKAPKATSSPPRRKRRWRFTGRHCSGRCGFAVLSKRCRTPKPMPISRPARAWRKSAPGPQSNPPRSKAGLPSKKRLHLVPPNSPSAPCHGHHTGSVTGWCRPKSSSGRSGHSACTTASALRAMMRTRPGPKRGSTLRSFRLEKLMPTSNQPRRTLLLTGASRGIGHATVKRFSAAGWRVITCSRHPFPENCPWEAGPEDHIQVDLADPENTAAAIEETKRRLNGELHALVNNAAISPKAAGGKRLGSLETSRDDWHHIFQVNFFAPIMLARGLLDELSAAKGSVVNVTSIAGSRVHPFAGTAYSTSKAALAALTREMAADFGALGIRVNAIAPGEIDTAMLSPGTEKIVENIPMHRLGTPDEVAKIIYVLCTETASYVNGAEIHINGGQHV